MRFWIVAVMIALLPLRGWVGDAMATQMATPAVTQHFAAGSNSLEHGHATDRPGHLASEAAQQTAPQQAPGDCAGHAGSGSPATSDASHCQSCVACQACHTVALAVALSVLPEPLHVPDVPRNATTRFTSADRALGMKPPIS